MPYPVLRIEYQKHNRPVQSLARSGFYIGKFGIVLYYHNRQTYPDQSLQMMNEYLLLHQCFSTIRFNFLACTKFRARRFLCPKCFCKGAETIFLLFHQSEVIAGVHFLTFTKSVRKRVNHLRRANS